MLGIRMNTTINQNDNKKKLNFTTVDDPDVMDQFIANKNSHHLNQTQGTSLIIEPMLSLIWQDSYTFFSQESLTGTTYTPSLNISLIITKYLNNLKQNKAIIIISINKHILVKEPTQVLRSERKELQRPLQYDIWIFVVVC